MLDSGSLQWAIICCWKALHYYFKGFGHVFSVGSHHCHFKRLPVSGSAKAVVRVGELYKQLRIHSRENKVRAYLYAVLIYAGREIIEDGKSGVVLLWKLWLILNVKPQVYFDIGKKGVTSGLKWPVLLNHLASNLNLSVVGDSIFNLHVNIGIKICCYDNDNFEKMHNGPNNHHAKFEILCALASACWLNNKAVFPFQSGCYDTHLPWCLQVRTFLQQAHRSLCSPDLAESEL